MEVVAPRCLPGKRQNKVANKPLMIARSTMTVIGTPVISLIL